jgi:hypothetical protein
MILARALDDPEHAAQLDTLVSHMREAVRVSRARGESPATTIGLLVWSLVRGKEECNGGSGGTGSQGRRAARSYFRLCSAVPAIASAIGTILLPYIPPASIRASGSPA